MTPRNTGLSSLSRPRLRTLTYEAVKRAILNMQYAPGEQLREQDLAKQLGVSRTPVHDALVRLEQEGFVEGEPFRGYTVATLQPEDVIEIFEMRKILEGHCARQAAVSLGPADLAHLRMIADAAEAATEAEDYARVHDLFTEFDDMLFAHLHNVRMRTLVGNLRDQIVMMGTLTVTLPGRARLSCREHRDIISAIGRCDAADAERAISSHIDSLRDSLLECLGSQSE